jgi:predicted amidohydrolase YtcJ
VRVVTQPHFIAERGDSYLRDIPNKHHDWLYRARAFLDAGVPLSFGSDGPYGAVNPWAAMQAAVTRATPSGAVLGGEEILSPEQALRGYLSSLDEPGGPSRRVSIGAAADLCVLDRPWRVARESLASVGVVLTLKDGAPIQGSMASISPQASAVAAEMRRPESAI